MQVIKSEQVICIDVDDTLVMHQRAGPGDSVVTFLDPYDKTPRRLVVHEPHVKILMDRKARGATIIVWSQSGYQWAEAIIVALGIQKYVDFIASKPVAYIDDKPVQDWMAERIYLSPASNYGKY